MIVVTDWPILQSINLGCGGGREDKCLIVNKQSQLETYLEKNLRTFGLRRNFFQLYKQTGLLGCSCLLARISEKLFGISPMFMAKVIYLNTSQHLSCCLYNSKHKIVNYYPCVLTLLRHSTEIKIGASSSHQIPWTHLKFIQEHNSAFVRRYQNYHLANYWLKGDLYSFRILWVRKWL